MTEYAPSAELGLILPIPETGQQWSTQKYIVDNFTKVDVRATSTRERLEELEAGLKGTTVERTAHYGVDPTTPTDRGTFANTFPIWLNEDKGYWQQYYCQFDDPGVGAATPARDVAGWGPMLELGRVALAQFSLVAAGGTGTLSKRGGRSVFTTANKFAMDNVFTDDFEDYELILDFTAASADTDIGILFRTGGVDNVAASYFTNLTEVNSVGGVVDQASTPGGSSGVSIRTGRVNVFGGHMAFRIKHPKKAARTEMIGDSIGADNYRRHVSLIHSAATAFDGILITSGSAVTLTGTARMYGINDQ